MKNRRFLSIVSLILVLVFVVLQASVLTACKKNNEGNGEESSTPEQGGNEIVLPPSPIGDATYIDTAGKSVVNANYCKDLSKYSLPALYHLSTDDGDTFANVGFLWNADNIMAIIDAADSDSATIKIGSAERTVTLTDAITTETFAFTDTGVLPQDLGQLIPVNVTVKAGDKTSEFDGYTQLADYKVCFSTDGSDLSDFTSITTTKAGSTAKIDPAVAGVESKDGAIRIYDTYANGKGIGLTQNKLQVANVSAISSSKPYIFELDMTVDSMPVYSAEFVTAGSTYGLYFNITKDATGNSPLFAIINTVDGLTLASVGADAEHFSTASLGKGLGETFHLSVVCETTGDVRVAVDGYVVANFTDTSAVRSAFPSKSINIICQRHTDAPKSDADNFDITIDSLCISYDQSKSLTDNIDITDLFGDNAVVQVGGEQIYLAPKAINAISELSSKQYGLSAKAYWVSSNPFVISHEGVLTAPEKSGEFVTYTLYILSGEHIVTSKEFSFFAKGSNPSTNVNFIKADSDPFKGKAVSADTVFTLDKALNSVVYDMGEVTDINNIVLKSTKHPGLVNKNFISIYYSSDNENYYYIEDFTLFQEGNNVYFYNFDVEARYIKVHSTLEGGYLESGRIINSLQNMLTAGYTEDTPLANGEFSNETSITVKNDSDKVAYDSVFSYTLDDLGINASDMKEDKSDIRFIMDGKCLPYYYDGSLFHVRVFELDADESASVKVIYGNKNAASLSNGNETFEMQYGTKFATKYNTRWQTSVAQMPNGDLLSMIREGANLAYLRSTNGGMTWSEPVVIPNTPETNIDGGGFVVDKENNKVFYFGYYWEGRPAWICKFYGYVSEDSGETWRCVGTPSNAPQYAITYSSGITLSQCDGDGPNVDYVITTGVMRNTADASFCTSAFYSKDGGETWTFSNSKINYAYGNSAGMEGGMSEDSVWEQADGTLIFYARCQQNEILHFAISRSYDHGVTWSEVTTKDFSTTYNPNTQPIIENLNGKPVLMWGGNNSIGGRSYIRFPLNMATSDDDANTFKNTVNITYQTHIDTADPNVGKMLHTNPDCIFYKYQGIDCVYVVSSEQNKMYIINADDHLYKTKGAFDSFEDGMNGDGWQRSRGGAITSTTGATDGNYALKILGNSVIARCLNYMEEGSISFDFYVSNTGSMVIELQTAFNHEMNKTAPVRIMADDSGNLSFISNKGIQTFLGLKLQKGNNTITLDFNGNEKTASITVNGTTKDVGYIGQDISIGYFTIFTSARTEYYIDRFIAIRTA